VRLLDRLVEQGLLERRPDPRDRRANRLFLTQRGRQLVDDLEGLHDAIATDVLQDIASDSIQTSLGTLIDVKDRIKGRIKGLGEHPGNIAAE
jgi:MarR family transcriptional regulator, transcriptional regulator for hemolysin